MKEAEFQSKVIALAKSLGYKVYHTADSRGSEPGFPDLVLAGKYVLFVELKTDKGRLSKEQEKWLDVLSLAEGVYASVWRPKDWTEIQKILTHMRLRGN